MTPNEFLENSGLALRRGIIVLAVLSQLQQEQYGYSLMKNLADKGLEIDQGTLYPLLRRLESQGLLDSNWRVDGDHPRRYYVISRDGMEALKQMKTEWSGIRAIMANMLGEKQEL
ncbi:MAG: PadR family transcriptional regulator [Dehalococcoidales bacterium]|nr:PadR family transcriptional regulator [Dehalococcoidales bacterium]